MARWPAVSAVAVGPSGSEAAAAASPPPPAARAGAECHASSDLRRRKTWRRPRSAAWQERGTSEVDAFRTSIRRKLDIRLPEGRWSPSSPFSEVGVIWGVTLYEVDIFASASEGLVVARGRGTSSVSSSNIAFEVTSMQNLVRHAVTSWQEEGRNDSSRHAGHALRSSAPSDVARHRRGVNFRSQRRTRHPEPSRTERRPAGHSRPHALAGGGPRTALGAGVRSSANRPRRRRETARARRQRPRLRLEVARSPPSRQW